MAYISAKFKPLLGHLNKDDMIRFDDKKDFAKLFLLSWETNMPVYLCFCWQPKRPIPHMKIFS